jgi:TrmH family RNA methyltransferase
MLSKSIIKYLRSLRDQKYRQKYHKIVVEGVKTVHDILSGHLVSVDAIYATRVWIDEKSASYGSFLPFIVEVKDHELESISSLRTPQEVLAVCAMPEHPADPRQPLRELCLYLDGIRDPGNMGTIFRIADWFGIRHMFLSEDCVDPYNPKVIQASMASLFRIKWSEYPLKGLLDISGLNAFAATLDGENIYTHKLSSTGMIVLGNESTGIRGIRDDRRIQPIGIPNMFCLGADSLNVAVAAGIICAEFRRRHYSTNLKFG